MVDYTSVAQEPYININAIGNALATRQYLQNQPMRQMQAAADLERSKYQNRILFMQDAAMANAEKVRRATVEAQLNAGIPEPVANALPPPTPAATNALMGAAQPPVAASAPPQGWGGPPMALPPESGNAMVAPASMAPPAPAARIPYSPEAEGQLRARMAVQETLQAQLKSKVEFAKSISEMDPALGKRFWDQDPMLRQLGPLEMNGDAQTKEVKVGTKVIGTMVKVPGGKWEYKDTTKGEGLTSEPGKLIQDRDRIIAAKVASGVKPEDALNDPDVKALDRKITEGKSAYPIGHIQQFQVGRNLIYREYMGEQKWKDRPDLGGGPKDLPPQVADDFKVWDKETKLWHFENFKNTGVKPDFGWGKDAGRSRAQFQREYAEWNIGKGVSGAEAGAVSSEFKAKQMSVRNQEKIRGMMGGFVRNMDKQVVRVDELFDKIVQRVGVRALDWPLREIKTRAIGSGNEAIIEAYLLEISNEIGKLSTGSAASIQELSKEAQVKWAKIHDPNLSPREIKKILTETRHMGKLRLDSSDEEIKKTLDDMKNIDKNVPVGKEARGDGKVVPRKPGESVADYLRRTSAK